MIRPPADRRFRLAVLGIGLLGNKAIELAFDYGLYPLVIWRFGLGPGAGVMLLLSFLVCVGTLKFYDRTRLDWLGIETLKHLKEQPAGTGWRRWAGWLLHRSDGLALVLLSIKFDPFITTAYLRHGAFRFNGMTGRDWRILTASTVISNAWWSFAVFGGLHAAEWLWQAGTAFWREP